MVRVCVRDRQLTPLRPLDSPRGDAGDLSDRPSLHSIAGAPAARNEFIVVSRATVHRLQTHARHSLSALCALALEPPASMVPSRLKCKAN